MFPTLMIVVGALVGGFVSGLAGFGLGLVALGIWLNVVDPVAAGTLVAFCSVAATALTIKTVWHAIDVATLWPMLAAGLVGVPLGTALLAHVDADGFRFGLGAFLLAYAAFMLLVRVRTKIAWGGHAADAAIGFAGGILGGLAGLSGPLPTVWASVRGWGKDERRGVFQAFNLVILSAVMVSHAASGLLRADFARLAVLALPGTFLGSWLGERAYLRLSDRHFHELVLWLLGVSGLMLVWTTFRVL